MPGGRDHVMSDVMRSDVMRSDVKRSDVMRDSILRDDGWLVTQSRILSDVGAQCLICRVVRCWSRALPSR